MADPRFPELKEFLQYFENNYLNGQFPPWLWNVYNNDTKNHLQSCG